MSRKLSVFVLFAVIAGLSSWPSAQVQQPPPPHRHDPSQSQNWPADQPPDPNVTEAQKRAQKELGKQRYKDIQKDSDRLLTLATQLKKQVDTAGEHTLSLDVIKKAEEIEKLAKDVRNKMKG